MRTFRFLLEAVLFRAVLGIARLAPRKSLLAFGSAVGALGFVLDRRHRRITIDNLRLAYGEPLTERELLRIARACWRHFGRVLMDALAVQHLPLADVRSLVHYEGLDHLRDAYRRGRGVLAFTAHYGNWELAGLVQGHLGFPLALVARPLDNPYLEKMLASLRGRSGNVIIHKRSAVREMVGALRRGIGVAILIDQDARDQGVFVPFFGRLASTTPTLASLALKTGASVIPVFTALEADGTYRIAYEPPVDVRETGDHAGDVLRITAECTAIIERWVRFRPELWLWMHRRWKTVPPE